MRTFRKRLIEVCGYEVEVVDFGYAQFYYPTFNGDAEFKVNSKGFRQLSSYLRTVTWGRNIVNECRIKIFGE